MTEYITSFWSIDFRTDATRTDAPVIKLGVLSEAVWGNGSRWLGMAFRRRITPIELDAVNLRTWPELSNLDVFMKGAFDQAWEAGGAVSSTATELGSDRLAARYPVRSALHFRRMAVELRLPDGDEGFETMYSQLNDHKALLAPTLTAPVIQIAPRPLRTPAEVTGADTKELVVSEAA